jgi:hypothetical protein
MYWAPLRAAELEFDEFEAERRKFIRHKGFQLLLLHPDFLTENKKSAGRPAPTLRDCFRNVSRLRENTGRALVSQGAPL